MNHKLFIPGSRVIGVKFDIRELLAEIATVLGNTDAYLYLPAYIGKILRELGYPCVLESYPLKGLLWQDVSWRQLSEKEISDNRSLVDSHYQIVNTVLPKILKEVGYSGQELIVGKTHYDGALLIVYDAGELRLENGWT